MDVGLILNYYLIFGEIIIIKLSSLFCYRKQNTTLGSRPSTRNVSKFRQKLGKGVFYHTYLFHFEEISYLLLFIFLLHLKTSRKTILFSLTNNIIRSFYLLYIFKLSCSDSRNGCHGSER